MMGRSFSPLEEARFQYAPPLPSILKEVETLKSYEEGSKTSPIQDVDKLAALFPKTLGQPLIHFKKGEKKEQVSLRVGVVLSGGQAAGGHNVIIGLFDALNKMHKKARLFGFLGGPNGIVKNQFVELKKEILDHFRNTGGFDLIGSGRTKIETDEQLEASRKNCDALNLDGLVIIGGDDSNTNAAILAEYFLTHSSHTLVIGVPKTIDGDLKNAQVPISFGFDTACKIYSEMIGNICRDALSAKKYTHFIKLMGRSASHIALECALQTHPNITLIGEEIAQRKMTLKEITHMICDMLCERSQRGKNYGVILIPEGLIEFVPEIKTLIKELNTLLSQDVQDITAKLSDVARETFTFLPKEIAQQLLLDRDPHGNVQVSHIATDQLLIHTVRKELEKSSTYGGKFASVGHFFGYEGRCGFPSNFDANYCYALGYTSAALVAGGHTGYMSVVQKLTEPPEHWEPGGIPLTMMMRIEERKGKQKPVIQKALVDLEGEPYKLFNSHRKQWCIEDHYRFPGPIQLMGPAHLCDEITFTLKLEQNLKVKI